jgi:fumarylacetoacetase
VAIGTKALDLTAFARAGHCGALDPMLREALRKGCGNAFLALGRPAWSQARRWIQRLLSADEPALRDRGDRDRFIASQDQLRMAMFAEVGDYTDFYASIHHATNVGSMFRPDNPLLPNYKYVPIGYHGRASSMVATETPVRRPVGQRKGPNDAEPSVGPSRSLDYECEVGVFIGSGNALGETIPLAESEQHMFGLCLVNDWSARDVQSWEYQPLGPFLAKNFATTLSPWVVTLDALEPFRASAFSRPEGDPPALSYLHDDSNESHGGFSITLEVRLQTAAMRERGDAPVQLSRTSFTHMYWTLAQMVTHHAMGGCNLRPGDLLASGTVSGPGKDERGCLLELTWRGAEPLVLPSGETRAFLEDGDLVELAGWCEAPGARRIGFGTCRGVVLPASV